MIRFRKLCSESRETDLKKINSCKVLDLKVSGCGLVAKTENSGLRGLGFFKSPPRRLFFQEPFIWNKSLEQKEIL